MNGGPGLMADFYYSAEARRDLMGIWEYIAQNDIDAADRVEKEIERAVRKLSANPAIGHVRRDLTLRGVRFWRVHSYLIAYSPETQPLEVVRILSGYRDIAELL